MNKFITGFVLGAVAGSAIAYYILKEHFERITQEEINSVKKVFANRGTSIQEEKKEIEEYKNELEKNQYVNYSNIGRNKMEKETQVEKPYVISPDDFGELDGYEQISLTYYADGVLTDDNNEPIEDVEATVGTDSLQQFGEYEEDSVFVRNDRLKCDYEILSDYRKYSDVVNTTPHHEED